MKTHVAFLAVSVLCLESVVFVASAAAQTPTAPAEVAPPAAPPPAEPAPAPPPLPPTGVDTAPPTPVNAPPPAAAPEPAGTAMAPGPATPAAAPVPAPGSLLPPLAEPATAPAPVPTEPILSAPRFRDAHIDRLLLSPTAETHPKGSFYVTDYEIFLLQLGYAVTDSTQISLSATPPLGEAGVVPADISVKTVLLREPHVSVAAIGSATGILGFEEVNGFVGRAGAAATFCTEATDCRLSFSMSTNVTLVGPASLLFSGAGLNYRAGRIVSIIAEINSLIPLGEVIGEANGLIGGVGARLSGRAWGVDLSLLKAGKAGSNTAPVIPFIAATYRYVP